MGKVQQESNDNDPPCEDTDDTQTLTVDRDFPGISLTDCGPHYVKYLKNS